MSKVYFSSLLKHYVCWFELETALNELNIEFDFLEGTKDIWVRDFMPLVSPEGRYITYTYAPDYLRDTPEYTTDGGKLMPESPLYPRRLNLVLDGGNIIWEGKQVIFTEKLCLDNRYRCNDFITELVSKLDYCRITILPWDRSEPYGHVDGMARFVDEKSVVMTNYCDFDKNFRQKVFDALSSRNMFKIYELHYDVDKPHKDNWAYINFLQVDDKFILPKLNAPEDEQAKRQIADIYKVPESNIRMVDIHTLLRRGGGLNCISWNAAPKKMQRKLISPNMENAFSSEVLKSVVENEIGHELRSDFWEAFNASFATYWNDEVGLGNDVYSGNMKESIFQQMKEKKYLVDYECVDKFCEIIIDFIEKIPGVLIE